MTPREEADRWRRQAEADLRTARRLLAAGEFGPCAFYCQQAAEKALKALLYSKGAKVFGHSLTGLLEHVINENFTEPSEAVRRAAEALDEHYISPRYPDAFEAKIPAEHYTAEMAEEAMAWAQLLLQYSGENLT